MRRANRDPAAFIPSAPPEPVTGTRRRAKTTDEFAPPKPKAERKPPETSCSQRLKYFAEADVLRQASKWDDARPGHFVALYGMLHARTYGAPPAELERGRDYAQAILAAATLLKREFESDPARMFEFLRWTWAREEGREKWRRQNANGGSRIGWRLQFGAALITDYRVERARRQHG